MIAPPLLRENGWEAMTGPTTFEGVLRNPSWPNERPLLITPDSVTTWGEMAAQAAALGDGLAGLAGRRVGLVFTASPACLATLALLDRLACDTFLMDGHHPEDAERLGAELRLGAVLAEVPGPGGAVIGTHPLPHELPGSSGSTVTILTSGTTGRPKAAQHAWPTLLRPVRMSTSPAGPRWLLSYRPHLYAGLQVLLQCLVNGGTVVVAGGAATPAATSELMRTAQVRYASATPSFWRRLLLFAPDVLRQVPLIQITLGGEVVDQQTLDGLRQAFPGARIVHIYATTELGRCFAVADGRAGFPTRYLLEPTPDGVELRLDQGELVVRSANGMRGYDPSGEAPSPDQSGYRTGDLVEIVGDRAYFVGRSTDLINVGGNKVHPVQVERVLRVVPGVADVRVYGKRSSIAGELVACQIVPAAGIDASRLREAIVTASLAALTPFQRPRVIDIVPEIALEESGKTSHRA